MRVDQTWEVSQVHPKARSKHQPSCFSACWPVEPPQLVQKLLMQGGLTIRKETCSGVFISAYEGASSKITEPRIVHVLVRPNHALRTRGNWGHMLHPPANGLNPHRKITVTPSLVPWGAPLLFDFFPGDSNGKVPDMAGGLVVRWG